MNDPTHVTYELLEPFEVQALDYTSQLAGEYLEEIKCTDLSRLSPFEWQTFLFVVCINFLNKYKELEPCPF